METTRLRRVEDFQSEQEPDRRQDRSEVHDGGKSPYRGLAVMGLLHFPLMYLVMFTMIDGLGDLYHNLNTAYMAVMMVAPMLFLMPLLMGGMYQDRKRNLIAYAGSIALFGLFYLFMRQQTFIDDKQFLRSMIPHHSGAILMCEKAKLQDSELRTLCDGIVKGQAEEIAQMKRVLERL